MEKFATTHLYTTEEAKQVVAQAYMKFYDILLKAGINENLLIQKNTVCPWCRSTNRFTYTDKFGRGDSYCFNCGYHNGVDLLMQAKNWSFQEAVSFIAEFVNWKPNKEQIAVASGAKVDYQSYIKKLLEFSHQIKEGDCAYEYLLARGITKPLPKSLWATSKLSYAWLGSRAGNSKAVYYPGLLAEMTDAEGNLVNLYRIYLQGNGLAPVTTSKKTYTNKLAGTVIRLGEVKEDGVLGVAEDLETALSATELFDIPVWSVISAYNYKTFVPPKEVKKLIFFGDNDSDFISQREVFNAATKLKQSNPELEIDVNIPDKKGVNWNDVLLARKAEAA